MTLIPTTTFKYKTNFKIIAIKNTDKRQRLGDLWAKTIVVDTKDMEQYFIKDTKKKSETAE